MRCRTPEQKQLAQRAEKCTGGQKAGLGMAEAEAGDGEERPTTASIEIQVYRPTTVGGSFTQLPRSIEDGSERERCPGVTTLKYRPDETPGLGLLDPDSGMMELFVKALSGKTISVHVDEEGEESIEDLKGKIELQTGIPVSEQHLVFAEMPMEGKDGEPRSLADYNIRKGPVPLTVYMVAKIEVTTSVHEIDMDDEEVVFGNLKKDLEGIDLNLEWLLNSEENTEVLQYEEEGPDNVLVAKMKEMTGTLRQLQDEREQNQARRVQLKKDIAKIGADKEDIIWHATRLCVEGPREDGLALRDRPVKVTEGPDGQLEAEWAKQWNLAAAARSVAASQQGGWLQFRDKILRPKNDGKQIPGAKAAVIELNLAAAKKNGASARERKLMHAQQIDEPMSKVWQRAIELGVLKDPEALAQQDAERRRAHAVLNKTNKEKDKIISELEAKLARARAVSTDRIESLEEQFRMLSEQRNRMCTLLGGSQDTLPLAIVQAHKKRMKTSMDNRTELMTMTRDFDIEKNERNKKAAAAIAKKQEELNADADQRARDKRTEAYAQAEKLATDVTSSSELVAQKMREHGQGSERATEVKRQTEIRQETEHALAVRNTKLLRRIKDLVRNHPCRQRT